MARLVGMLLGILLLGVVPTALLAARQLVARPPSDLDAFMEKVLARRDDNWKKLQQYVLDEREQMEIRGPANLPIWGENREYTWYLREGFFVRSPVKANGATVSEGDRRDYEDKYFNRVKERDRRRGGGAGPVAPTVPTASTEPTDAAGMQNLIAQSRQPAFIDSAYFLRFKFEPSKYALVGRESFDGRDTLRIEYYPSRLFSREQDQQQRRREQNRTEPSRDRNAALERMMNKVSLVTIWVDQASHQIVKYTFDNVNLDFLPAAWLVHMTDAKATMTMSQPMPGVWLPRDVNMAVSGTLAIGSFDIRYRLDYLNYRQAETSSRFRIGRGSQ
jgi:hypothetical protein